MRLIVIAKAPVPGRVKTRLCPPCTPADAAALAEAALADTLDAVLASGADDRVVALDGGPWPGLPSGVRVIRQRGGTLDARLAGAFDDAGGPALLIGMDTPQVTPETLDAAMAAMDGVDAVLGDAHDGGWWAIGLHRADPRVFLDIEMSAPDTGRRQRERLRDLGLRVGGLPRLRDVDTIDDAVAVAADAPGGRFAAALSRLPANEVTA